MFEKKETDEKCVLVNGKDSLPPVWQGVVKPWRPWTKIGGNRSKTSSLLCLNVTMPTDGHTQSMLHQFN